MNTPAPWDRAVSLYFMRPLLRFFPVRRPPTLSLLMYHGISEIAPGDPDPAHRLRTSPAQFAAQLTFLKSQGYAVLPLPEATHRFFTGTLPGPAVCLTFDDGFADFYDNAFPLLRQQGYPATVFLPTDFITRRDLRFKGENHLNWDQVVDLSKQGILFGSHTLSHPHLEQLEYSEIEHEVLRSKEIIENHLGAPITCFAYPFAFPEADEVFLAVLKACLTRAAYTVGVTTKIGTVRPGQDPLFLHRIPMDARDDLPLFRAKLEGAYDWIHPFQYAAKWAKQKQSVWT